MSKTLTKILTICGLCVVVVAAVIASAVCATAAIGYNVTVDVVKLLNEDFNSPDGNVKIKINGEETNELLVKKGDEAIITFETTDFDFQGYFKGDKGTYVGTQPIVDEHESLVQVLKVVVTEDTDITAVFKAATFYKLTLASQTDSSLMEDRMISIGAIGASVYGDAESTNVYWAKKGSRVELIHSEVGFVFNKWYDGDVSQNVERESTVEVVENNKVYTADFSIINKYTVTIASAYDASADGGNISAVANGDKTSITVWDGEKINLSTSATGYNFVNWTANGTAIGTTQALEYEVTGNAEIKANYNVIKYNISYDGAEAVSTVWGSALSSPASTYNASTGWKVFTGWKLNGNPVEKAVFSGTDTNISLTGEYNVQSATTYTFATADKTITYKTVAENRLGLTNAPSKKYYTLVGISFTIGGTDFVFDISGNNLETVEGGKTLEQLDTALRDVNVTTIAATPIYELNFTINFTVATNNDFGAEGDTKTISMGSRQDIASIKVLEYFANSGANLDSVIGIMGDDAVTEGDNSFSFGQNLKEITVADIINEIDVTGENTSPINLSIKFYLAS